MPSGFVEEPLLQVALDVFQLFFFALANLPGLECDEEEPGVRALHLGQQREVGDCDHALDSGSLEQGVGDLLLSGIRTLCRCAIGQLQCQKHVALIFRGDEPAGKAAAQQNRDARPR